MSHSVLKELQGRSRGDAPTPPPPSRALEPPPHTCDKTLESPFSSSPSHQPQAASASPLLSTSNHQDISAEAASTKLMLTANQEPPSSSFSSNGEVADCSKLFGEDDTGKNHSISKFEQFTQVFYIFCWLGCVGHSSAYVAQFILYF
jgi:hypothetical protein